jgi:hypothetical protein
MHLFLVHCGYYERNVGNGIYESHTNFFVVAEDWKEAKTKIKQNLNFMEKHMHVDGVQKIEVVEGFKVHLTKEPKLENQTQIESLGYEDIKKLTS